MDADQIVTRIGQTDLLNHVAPGLQTGSGTKTVQKIGQQKNDRAAMEDVIEESQRRRDIRLAPLWFKGEHLADDSQYVPAAFARREKQLRPIGEQEQTDRKS